MKFSVFVEPNNLSHRLDSNYYSPEDIVKEELIKRSNFDYLNNRAKKIAGGATPKGANYLNKGIAFIRTQNINNNLIDDKDLVYISSESNEELKRSQLKENDVLLTITGVDLGHSAVVSKAILPANINQHSVKIEVKNIDPHFLSVFLNSSYGQSQIWRRVYGATRPAINYEEIKEIVIPVPSENIQNYIGNKVRKAEELREEAKRLKEKISDSIFQMIQLEPLSNNNQKHFGVKVEVSNLSANRLDAQYYKDEYLLYEEQIKKQNVVKFVDILKQAKYGASVQAEYRSDGIPFIRGNNLSPNEIETTDIVYLDNSLVDGIGTCYVEEGDILITRSGTVGICAVVDDFHNNFAYGSFIIRLRVDNSRWNPYYIAAFLNSFWGKWQVERLQNGAVQQNINIEEIGQILIPVVPKDQQDLVEQIVREYINMTRLSKQLIDEAKQDVEDLVEGKFDESKISEGV
jgi:type I restriction enzyme, S subunit